MAHTEAELTECCPGEEDLLSYMLSARADDRADSVTVHLQGCNACFDEVSRVRRRLALTDQIACAVPADVAQRALNAFGGRAPVPRPTWMQRIERWYERLTDLRPLMLVPVGAAAVLMLMLNTRAPESGPPTQVELTRDVQLRQEARITSASAMLHAQPDRSTPSVRTLSRGDSVVLFDRQEDWYQVGLADGTKGWMEVGAFQ